MENYDDASMQYSDAAMIHVCNVSVMRERRWCFGVLVLFRRCDNVSAMKER
jgi:hypothetical protein